RHGKMGAALAAALSLASVGSISQSAPADTSSLCLSRPEGAGPVPSTLAQWAEGAQLFDGLGDFHRAVTTGSQPAQAYFDQGMRFLWAFNHDEATRSFARAAQLDPECAMCSWG